MLKNRCIAYLICCCTAALNLTNVQADEYHHVNMLIGDRAAGMGGAYTAISDDATGLYYNPAGIVYATSSEISGSMSTYHEATTTYKNVLEGRYDWERDSSSLMPNFFGFIRPWGKGTFGFSFAVPNSIEEDQDQNFPFVNTSQGIANNYIINFNNNDKTYNFGPTYAYKITDYLSFGGTLYFHYRQQQRIDNLLLIYSGDREWNNDYFELEELGLKPVLGVMWLPAKRLAIGATFSQVNLMNSTQTRYQTCIGSNAVIYPPDSLCQSNNKPNLQIVESDEKADYPNNFKLGVAWFVDEELLFTGDISYHSSIGSGEDERISVVNYSFGTEYYLSTRGILRGGFYTDHSTTPMLKENFTDYNQPEHIDVFGLTASISYVISHKSSITFGIDYAIGDGKAQMIEGEAALQDVEMERYGISLAASYAY